MLARKLSVPFTVLSRDPTCDQLMNNSGHYKSQKHYHNIRLYIKEIEKNR